MERKVVKMRSEKAKGGKVLLSINPYFIPIGIRESLEYVAETIKNGSSADSILLIATPASLRGCFKLLMTEDVDEVLKQAFSGLVYQPHTTPAVLALCFKERPIASVIANPAELVADKMLRSSYSAKTASALVIDTLSPKGDGTSHFVVTQNDVKICGQDQPPADLTPEGERGQTEPAHSDDSEGWQLIHDEEDAEFKVAAFEYATPDCPLLRLGDFSVFSNYKQADERQGRPFLTTTSKGMSGLRFRTGEGMYHALKVACKEGRRTEPAAYQELNGMTRTNSQRASGWLIANMVLARKSAIAKALWRRW